MVFKTEHIPGSHIAVLGAGKSGLAVSRLLLRKGAKVFLSEEKSSYELEMVCEELAQSGLDYELGGNTERVYTGRDIMVLSPGIGLDNPIVIEAKKRSVYITGELEMAYRFCKSPIIAVTGTNGKSTTTAMIENIYCTADRPVLAGGNLGIPFSEFVDKTSPDITVVLEISSYQLETIETFHPKAAIILNITPDHILRHKTMEEYIRCKFRIGENQNPADRLILNMNDPILASAHIPGNATRLWFNNTLGVRRGTGVIDNTLYLFGDNERVPIFSVKDIPVPGSHNVDNALAAAAASFFLGVTPEEIALGLRTFKGLEHRLEYVNTINGITFVNDSKATNIDSLMIALSSFDKPVILIAGGRDKGSDLSVANELIKSRVKRMILLGEAADRMEKAWSPYVPILERVKTFADGVHTAFTRAVSGDTILLSPGCASFDMFTNFEERGYIFKELVRSLKKY